MSVYEIPLDGECTYGPDCKCGHMPSEHRAEIMMIMNMEQEDVTYNAQIKECKKCDCNGYISSI